MRSNVYLLIELILVSVLTFYMVDYLFVRTYNRSIPMGFDTDKVYLVNYMEVESDDDLSEKDDSLRSITDFRRFIDRIRSFPEIEGVALSDRSYPYSYYSMSSGFVMGEDTVSLFVRSFYPESDYFKVFRFQPVSGASPESLDNHAWKKEDLIVSLKNCPEHTTIRKLYQNPGDDADSFLYHLAEGLQPVKCDPFGQPQGIIFKPVTFARNLMVSIRIREGGSEKLAVEDLMDRMPKELNIGNFRFLSLVSYDQLRRNIEYENGDTNANRLMIALLAFFWLNMALCIYGTFWLKNESRLCESGIRLAVGCSRRMLFKSYLAEGLILVTIACMIGFIIVGNLYSAELMIGGVTNDSSYWINNWKYRFVLSALATWFLILVVVIISVWIPACRATRVQPSRILHEE